MNKIMRRQIVCDEGKIVFLDDGWRDLGWVLRQQKGRRLDGNSADGASSSDFFIN